ncbi:hypothetical protein DFH29DRAFT_900986 [Suillus ampliporus]|nr:hypothetical protein DFH29DRAFT_900986 [Suillus ampliporus]
MALVLPGVHRRGDNFHHLWKMGDVTSMGLGGSSRITSSRIDIRAACCRLLRLSSRAESDMASGLPGVDRRGDIFSAFTYTNASSKDVTSSVDGTGRVFSDYAACCLVCLALFQMMAMAYLMAFVFKLSVHHYCDSFYRTVLYDQLPGRVLSVLQTCW